MFLSCICHVLYFYVFFFFNDTATTEIYTTDTLFPYTTLFRSRLRRPVQPLHVLRVRRRQGPEQPDPRVDHQRGGGHRSEEHTSELQSLMRISYAVFCLKKKKKKTTITQHKKKT